MKIGCAFNCDEIMYHLNAKLDNTNNPKLISRIFRDSVKIMVHDVIDNNTTIRMPVNNMQLHIVPITGEEFQKAKQKGYFKNVDILKSFFTANIMVLDCFNSRTGNMRRIPFNLGSSLRKKLDDYTNKGKQYS